MVQLGEKYTDWITGFTGTATARTEYLFGCVRVMLESADLKEDGTPLEAVFDEQRLTSSPSATSGGPRSMPTSRGMVSR